MKNMILVRVLKAERSSEAFGPIGLLEHQQWLEVLIDQIPSEFHDSATIRYETFDNYGCDDVEVTIEYRRPETDAEYAFRLALEDQRKEEVAQRERAEFERLKKKFQP